MMENDNRPQWAIDAGISADRLKNITAFENEGPEDKGAFFKTSNIQPFTGEQLKPLFEKALAEKEKQAQTLRNQVARLLLTMKSVAQAIEKMPVDYAETISSSLWRAIATYDE